MRRLCRLGEAVCPPQRQIDEPLGAALTELAHAAVAHTHGQSHEHARDDRRGESTERGVLAHVLLPRGAVGGRHPLNGGGPSSSGEPHLG